MNVADTKKAKVMAIKQLTARKYDESAATEWNSFVAEAKNATFLHHRDFLYHHSDFFEDSSFLVDLDNKPVALFPANAVGQTIESHGGLTYGGILTSNKMTAELMLEIVELLIKELKKLGFTKIRYKQVPHIFCKQPADEDIFALMQHGLQMTRSDLSFVIPLDKKLPFSTLRKRMVNKANRYDVSVRESSDLATYWQILTDALQKRHMTKPTHTLAQISYLQKKFPEQIRLFSGFSGDQMVAGVLIFDCGQTIHTQYIVASEDGLKLGALDLIFHKLINQVFNDRTWFSFGSASDEQGTRLNKGLARQKEMFGARSVVFQQFELAL